MHESGGWFDEKELLFRISKVPSRYSTFGEVHVLQAAEDVSFHKCRLIIIAVTRRVVDIAVW